MIKEIFLPAQIGNYRLYSERILGFSINENVVTCAQIHTKRSKTIIEKFIKEKIETTSEQEYSNNAAQAILKILEQTPKYDQVRICIPSTIVIFKELEVPFVDEEKIRMVLDYEIESMLPFSINEAITDFIITQKSKEENKSQILVAAVRKNDLQNILDIYHKASIEPYNITIDLFASYSLFQQIPEYKNLKKTVALIDLSSHSTRVTLLDKGALRLTRIIPRGIFSIAKTISLDLNLSSQDIEKKFLSIGLQETGEPEYDKSLKKHLINFFNDIQFTLNSFGLKLGIYDGISKILFTGTFSNLKNLPKFCNNLLQISCEEFDIKKVFSNPIIKNKLKTIPYDSNLYMPSLGTALPSIEQSNFDLRRKSFTLNQTQLINKQLITAIIIIFLMFFAITINGYFQINKLSETKQRIEKREIEKLEKIFPKDIKFRRPITFANMIQRAKKFIAEKYDMWSPFSQPKLKPLEILQELTNILDKRRFDVSIEEVSINQEEGIPKIFVEGFFKSKTGSYHFGYFAELEKRFYDSQFLTLWNPKEKIDARMLDDKGIKFTVKLKQKEL